MPVNNNHLNILYVFGGEKAQGAEIVIERLMYYNAVNVNTHLILSPGKFADDLLSADKPYQITVFDDLKKLYRSRTGKFEYYLKAIRNYFTVSFKVYRYIKTNGIDIVHANTMVAASYLIPLILFSRLFLKGVKWYWSDHDLKYFSKLDTTISKICLQCYDYTLVVSEVVKRKYKRSSKVIVLYNGLDPEYFKPDAVQRNAFRDRLVIGENLIVIGLAATITPDKGQLDLIKAFNNLSVSYADIRLVLAGGFATDTPRYSQEVQLAVANNKENIIYLGYIDNITEFFNGCDIIINNSSSNRSEPLGTTIYEAMACEKLVAASNTGGTPEIITDDTDGFIFETESVESLQQKLVYIFENYPLKNIRINAREKVIKKFNITSMAHRYNNIIKLF